MMLQTTTSKEGNMFIKDNICSRTKLVNCRMDKEVHDEYMSLKKILRRHGYRISLAGPFEEAARKVNKEIKDKLKELNIDL